jgi:hypothetical protein
MNNNAEWWGMGVQTHEKLHPNKRTPVHVADIKSSNGDSQMFDLHENPGKTRRIFKIEISEVLRCKERPIFLRMSGFPKSKSPHIIAPSELGSTG